MRGLSTVDRRVHLLRQPLPWRKGERVTMCGRKVTERCRVATPEDFEGKRAATREWPGRNLKHEGETRCAACESYRADDHHWADQIQNELLQPSSEPKRIHHELEAIRELVERHRPEFESLLAATQAEAALQESHGTVIGRERFVGDAFTRVR